MNEVQFNFDYVILMIGALVPFITALVKKFGVPDWQSGLMTLFISAVGAGFEQIIDIGIGNVNWELFLGDWAQVWGIALLTWLGLSRNATDKLLAVIPKGLGRVGTTSTSAGYNAETSTSAGSSDQSGA